MREVPINQAKSILKRVLKGKTAIRITLPINKKDRSLKVTVTDQQVTVTEHGYVDAKTIFQLGDATAKHQVTTAFKREFPRSHQLYMSEEKI